jgi:hypothetical protein
MYYTTQHNTIEYNTMQYNKQYNTTQDVLDKTWAADLYLIYKLEPNYRT